MSTGQNVPRLTALDYAVLDAAENRTPPGIAYVVGSHRSAGRSDVSRSILRLHKAKLIEMDPDTPEGCDAEWRRTTLGEQVLAASV